MKQTQKIYFLTACWQTISGSWRYQPSLVPFYCGIIHFINKDNQVFYSCCFCQHSMLSEIQYRTHSLANIKKQRWKYLIFRFQTIFLSCSHWPRWLWRNKMHWKHFCATLIQICQKQEKKLNKNTLLLKQYSPADLTCAWIQLQIKYYVLIYTRWQTQKFDMAST